MRFIIATYISGAIIAFVLSLVTIKRYGYRITLCDITLCFLLATISWMGVFLLLDEYDER